MRRTYEGVPQFLAVTDRFVSNQGLSAASAIYNALQYVFTFAQPIKLTKIRKVVFADRFCHILHSIEVFCIDNGSVCTLYYRPRILREIMLLSSIVEGLPFDPLHHVSDIDLMRQYGFYVCNFPHRICVGFAFA